MAKGFLQKILGKPSLPPPEVAAALRDLAALAERRPTLSAAVAVLREALPALYAEPVRETAPSLERSQAATRIQGGMPLLRGESLALQEDVFRRRWEAVCTAVRKNEAAHDLAQGQAGWQSVLRCTRSGRLRPIELLQELLAGQPQAVHRRAEEIGVDPGQFATIFRLTLFPVLSHCSADLHFLLKDLAWQQGFCWCCGSWPLLGEFRGLEQIRLLRCGWCAAAWEFPRSRCPFCGNDDHRTLGYFHGEGEENQCRAATCEQCRSYVKMVTTLQALSGPALLTADLATTHLDLVLLERGYGLSG